jgi:hypothetical protein
MDRGMSVPEGHIVRTDYVQIEKIRMACRERMAVGDVDRAYQKVLQQGAGTAWPPPYGRWEGETFLLLDGRHEFIASLMLGKTHLLVAWVEPAGQ